MKIKLHNTHFLNGLVGCIFGLGTIGLSQAQCVPTFPDGCIFGDQVHTFQLSGDGSGSINDIFSGCSSGAYKNSTGTASILLSEDKSYTANISSNNTEDYVAIWIDFNGDDEFDESERVVAYNSPIASGFSTSPISFTIPNAVISGVFTMRVMVGYPYTYPDYYPITANLFDPCNSGVNRIAYGEIHDYSVEISASPLSSEIGKLSAFWQDNYTTQLNWSTLSENNVNGFKVLKSTNGQDFKEIGFLQSQAENGNSTQTIKYSFVDAHARSEKVFYKVIQIDLLDRELATNIVMLKQKVERDAYEITPNPAGNMVTIHLGKLEKTNAVIYVYDINGKQMDLIKPNKPTFDWDISKYPAGMYIFQYQDSYQSRQIKVIKQQ